MTALTITPRRPIYHGVRFRSQLESKFARHLHSIWAGRSNSPRVVRAFHGLFPAWEMWVYEPRIFGPRGRGYLPDFELVDKPQPTYIEVKPTLSQVPAAQIKMSVIWETHPNALLIVACAEGSTYFASVARGPWRSWIERWKSR